MELKLSSGYKSITDNDKQAIERLNFPDFSIITGANGSGKTHLLEGMNNRKIQILDDNGHPNTYKVVYFNYADFNFNCDKPRQNMPSNDPFHELRKLKNAILQFVRKDKLHVPFDPLYKPMFALSNTPLFLDYSDFSFSKLLFHYRKADINEKRKLVDTFVREMISKKVRQSFGELVSEKVRSVFASVKEWFSKKEHPDLNVTKIISEALESFVSKYDHLIKDKTVKEIRISSKERNFSETEMGKNFIRICEKYFLDRARHLSRDRRKSSDSKETFNIEKSREDFIESNGNNPLADFNKILRKIGLNNYSFKEEFPLKDDDIIRLSPQDNEENTLVGYQYIPLLSNGKILITIDALSSGEQILLGLATFFYDQKRKKNENFVLLLDEVDTNLQPSMIKKLLSLIQNNFIKDYKLKVFLVTHSPTTVALAPENSVFVMHRPEDDKPRIEESGNENALKILSEGFVSITKNSSDLEISYNISRTKLPVLFVEGITDRIILETAWKKLFPRSEQEFLIEACQGTNFISAMLKNPNHDIFTKNKKKKFISLFDFDQEGYNHWKDLKKSKFPIEIEASPSNCLTIRHENQEKYAILLPVPETSIKDQVINSNNTPFDNPELSIELLFYGTLGVSEQHFEKVEFPGCGKVIKFKGDKAKFASIIGQVSDENFENFRPLFEQIKKILDR